MRISNFTRHEIYLLFQARVSRNRATKISPLRLKIKDQRSLFLSLEPAFLDIDIDRRLNIASILLFEIFKKGKDCLNLMLVSNFILRNVL